MGMDSTAFLNDLMSKMKLSEPKTQKKAGQKNSIDQILAAMQKAGKKKTENMPAVSGQTEPIPEPAAEQEEMENFSDLATQVWQECRPAEETPKPIVCEKTIRVAAYIRVSSTNPAQEDSYETQERYFMTLLAKHTDWASAGIYSDHGISATSKERRTGFNRLLRHCRQGKIDRIICKSISRFARNTRDFLVALRILKENHVTILFEREAMDTADAYSEFVLTTLAAIAQEESRSISSNILWSNQRRFPAGNVCNKDIYGYEFRDGEYTVNSNGYRYRAVFIIPEEAEVVRTVYRLFTEEGLGFTQIAQKLDGQHISPPNSGCRRRQMREPTLLEGGDLIEESKRGWTASDVRYMISNIRYAGCVMCQQTYTDANHSHGRKQKINHGERPKYLIRDHHPAIISEELWQEAQEVWKVNSAHYVGPRAEKPLRPYSKLLVCGMCGQYFTLHDTTRTTIWRCATMVYQHGQKQCRMEKVYEEQIRMILRKAFAEKFSLGKADEIDADVSEVMRVLSAEKHLTDRPLIPVLEKLREIHDFDRMEEEGDFLKRQLSALQYTIRDTKQHIRDIEAEMDVARVRSELLNEPLNEEAQKELDERIRQEREQLGRLECEEQQQKERLQYQEAYWRKLEQTYEIREKAIAWLETQNSVQDFLKGAVETYVKAFILSITVVSPRHFKIHWFDDSHTEVEVDSVFEGYQLPGRIRRRKKI